MSTTRHINEVAARVGLYLPWCVSRLEPDIFDLVQLRRCNLSGFHFFDIHTYMELATITYSVPLSYLCRFMTVPQTSLTQLVNSCLSPDNDNVSKLCCDGAAPAPCPADLLGSSSRIWDGKAGARTWQSDTDRPTEASFIFPRYLWLDATRSNVAHVFCNASLRCFSYANLSLKSRKSKVSQRLCKFEVRCPHYGTKLTLK